MKTSLVRKGRHTPNHATLVGKGRHTYKCKYIYTSIMQGIYIWGEPDHAMYWASDLWTNLSCFLAMYYG